MTASIDSIYDHMAVIQARAGKRTGGISKILSHAGILLFFFGTLLVFEQRNWIAILALGLAYFITGPFGMLFWLGIVGYLIYVGNFFAAAILGLSYAFSFASYWSGFRNAKREIMNGATGISPFEGMSTGFSLIFQGVTLSLAWFTTGLVSLFVWIIFAVAILYSTTRYLFRLYPRWARIHYPLMNRWSSFAAQAAARHLQAGKPVDVTPELKAFVISIIGQEDDLAREAVDQADRARMHFSDEDLLREVFRERILPEKFEEFMDNLRELIASSEDVGMRLRWIIASFVEKDFGRSERALYLKAVLESKAA